jgi:hypothetical protein
MTPIQKAKLMYEALPRRSFWQDVNTLTHDGYVVSTPELFLMAFAVKSEDFDNDPIQLMHRDPNGDTWFVWCLVGSLQQALRMIPHPKKYIGFARRGVLRLHEFEETTRLCARSPLSGLRLILS